MGSVTALPTTDDPERLTRRPAGLGPLWSLCPTCKGAGGGTIKVDEHQSFGKKCSRCAGKGMVLE